MTSGKTRIGWTGSRVSRGADDVLVADGNGNDVAVGWGALAAATSRLATFLRRRGLRDGATAVVSGSTTYQTLVAIFAAWECGAAVTVVPAGMRRDPSLVARDIEQAVEQLDARAVYAPPAVHDRLSPGLGGGRKPGPIVLHDRTVAAETAGDRGTSGDIANRLRSYPDDALAVLQPTSGTTGRSRIVPVTWGMLRHNVAAIASRLGLGADDSFVSWMPLFHDMGLVLFLVAPATLGARLTLLPPETFAVAPWLFAALADRRQGTVGGTTSSGLALLERGLRSPPRRPFDLSSLRSLVCGAEMIDVELCERAISAGAVHGLGADVLSFGYGMAEATLAVSLNRPARPGDAEDMTALGASDGLAGGWLRPPGRGFARTGPPVAGTAVRIVTAGNQPGRGEREVGEIAVRGPSVMSAYLGHTAAASGIDEAGWFRTGDLGFLSGGQVVVVGRCADVVVVGGLKVVPDDVERIVGAIAGVRAGRVAAVPVRGRAGEALGIVAERSDGPDGATIDERTVRTAVRRELGVAAEAVTFVPRGTVPKTTSGKLRRSACRPLLAAPGPRP